jgi:hypothetical protein
MSLSLQINRAYTLVLNKHKGPLFNFLVPMNLTLHYGNFEF